MDGLKAQWQELEARVDALSPRERIYLLLIVVTVCWAAWDFLVNSPLAKERDGLRRAVVEAESQLAAADQLIQVVLARQKIDPDVLIRQRLERLEGEMSGLAVRKQEVAASFLNPRDMADLLQHLLKRQGGLQLIGLETLPTQPLVKPAADDKSNQSKGGPERPMIYRHDLAIEFEGTYFDMVTYLKALESQPVFWEAAEFLVKNYPKARVRLQVYTLSFEKEWLGV